MGASRGGRVTSRGGRAEQPFGQLQYFFMFLANPTC